MRAMLVCVRGSYSGSARCDLGEREREATSNPMLPPLIMLGASCASWMLAVPWVARSSAASSTIARCSSMSGLLTLGDGDPFADDYPPATVETQISAVRLVTTAGDCIIVTDRAYSPVGVDRFLDLVRSGFFTDMLLYRVLPGYLIQFGCASDPATQAQWENTRLPDEPNRATFRGGTLSYAGSGTDSRSCHFFVALSPQGAALGGAAHEATIGHVQEVEVFEKVASNFEANYPALPDLSSLQRDLILEGNGAASEYPELDRILRADILG